jgi:hypothetical protein
MLMVILLLVLYTIWMWAVLSAFRRYVLPPSLGRFSSENAELCRISSNFKGYFTAAEYRVITNGIDSFNIL